MEAEIIEYKDWDNTYIILDDGIIEKFSDPYIYGSKQQKIMKNIASILVSFLSSAINDLSADNTAIIRILEGGKYYYIYEAFKEIIGAPLLGEIDIKSRFKYDPKDVPTVIVKDLEFSDKANKRKYFIIIDTIASGSTMETFLKRLLSTYTHEYMLIVGGIATYYGLERVRRLLDNYRKKYMLIAYGGLLGLGENRTDMTLGHKPNYIPPKLFDKAVEMLGLEITSKLCVIGDFTYSNVYVDRYLAERIIQIWEIGANSNLDETKEKARRLVLEGLDRLLNIVSLNEIESLLAEEYRRRLLLVGKDVDIKKLSIDYVVSLEPIKVF